MCLYDDGDTYGFVSMGSGERRARVEHKCLECSRTIEPGESYRYWTAIDTDVRSLLGHDRPRRSPDRVPRPAAGSRTRYAMCAATGETPKAIEAWMDRAVSRNVERPEGA